MLKFINNSPLKGNANQKSLCADCIHKCNIKNITLCNIDMSPSLFHYNFINKGIKECKDYCSINNAYPKLNVHSIWDWCNGFAYPTPIVLCCKHDIAEYEQSSIDDLSSQINNITKSYNVKLKGFPWIINLAEISDIRGLKIYRTSLISDVEINNILKNIRQ